MAADPFVAEALAGAIGVEPFVFGTFDQLHKYQVERAALMGHTMDRRVLRFLVRTDPEASADLPNFDFSAVADALTRQPTPMESEAVVGAFVDPELGLAVSNTMARIRAQLFGQLPRRERVSLAGVEHTDPPGSDVARFRRLWTVACDPMSVLDELNEFALSWDQARALKELYPELHARADQAVKTQLSRLRANRSGFRLLRQKEGQLRVLLQLPPLGIEYAADMQAIYAKQRGGQGGGGGRRPSRNDGKKSAASNETSAQRIEQG